MFQPQVKNSKAKAAPAHARPYGTLAAIREFLDGFSLPSGSFDPRGSWKQSYAILLSSKGIGTVGYLEIEREASGGQRYLERGVDEQWRFYLWSYYRHVEMVDAEVGRVLDALEDSGERENTVIILTSDHGEGRGRHHMVGKNYLYDEASRVPFLISWPGRLPAGKQDTTHLVSGIDIMPTICDYAGVKAPAEMTGRSVRPLIEGKQIPWREFVAAEVAGNGRMIRTPSHKYIAYADDPVEQLFDMRTDTGETKNLAPDSRHAPVLEAHRGLLKEWTGHLKLAPRA